MTTITPSSHIDGVHIVEPTVHRDARGAFVETFRREWFPGSREMIQANRGERVADSIVGLHYHLHQADYWMIQSGHARVVLHDLRVGSPTDGGTHVIDVGDIDGSGLNHLGVYIPPGVAHGFAAVTDLVITYLVDGYYNPADELGVAWDDAEIGADWGIDEPVLSDRDWENPRRADIPDNRRPHGSLRR